MTSRRPPVIAVLSACLLLIGTSAAAIAPYRAIVAIDNLGMSNAFYALIVTLSSIGTAVASLVMGYFSDRIPDRRLLVLACAALGGLAYGLIYLFPTQLVYVLAFCIVLPFGGALFSQTFAFSRVYHNLRNPVRAEFSISFLRTLYSASWVIVPPLAGWIASTYTVFDLFAIAALAHVGCTLLFGFLLLNPEAKVGAPKVEQAGDKTNGLALPIHRLIGIGGVTLIRVVIVLNITTFPLLVINRLDGTLSDVGIAASIAAGLEIPFMLFWGWAASKVAKETILMVTALIYSSYLLGVFFANSVEHVFWLQGLAAVSASALLSINISYLQESIKGRVGLSTSLIDVVTVTSVFVSSAIFAALSSSLGYSAVFIAASAVSLAAAVLMKVSHFRRLAASPVAESA